MEILIKIKISLRPIVNKINLPTVIKTAIFPKDGTETLFIATQVGEILYVKDGELRPFLNIRDKIIKLEEHEERGLIGLAFHPRFNYNGLFYLHYSVDGAQGLKPFSAFIEPSCDSSLLNLKWEDRDTYYDHIDTIEEWFVAPDNQPRKRRNILNIKRPFNTHNGFNSLNFSPETGKLVLTTGDGGSSYDPFNLSQHDMEIAGKIIEIDVDKNVSLSNTTTVTRFDEIPVHIQEILTVIAKGIRNISGVSFQKNDNKYIKYIGNVGQKLVESVFSFVDYTPVPVTELVLSKKIKSSGFINFGWRAWEGNFPTTIIKKCPDNELGSEKTIAYYDEAIEIGAERINPIATYFHEDKRTDKFSGNAITGVRPYKGGVIFSNLMNKNTHPARGGIGYIKVESNCRINDFNVINIDYDFGEEAAYFVGLGSNIEGSNLYLAVCSSTKVTDFNQGTIFEIIFD